MTEGDDSKVSNEHGPNASVGATSDFGANDWLVVEMYERYVEDKNSVDEAWWPTLEQYERDQKKSGAKSDAALSARSDANATKAKDATSPNSDDGATQRTMNGEVKAREKVSGERKQAKTTTVPPKAAPIPAQAPDRSKKAESVSYTHLTLPTIYSV